MFSSLKKSFESLRRGPTEATESGQTQQGKAAPTGAPPSSHHSSFSSSPETPASASSLFSRIVKAVEEGLSLTPVGPSGLTPSPSIAFQPTTSTPIYSSASTSPSVGSGSPSLSSKTSSSSSSSSSSNIPIKTLSSSARSASLGTTDQAVEDFAPLELWKSNVNSSAGQELLTYFDQQKQTVHLNNVSNARDAEDADRRLRATIAFSNKHYAVLKDFDQELCKLPVMIKAIESITVEVAKVNEAIERLEKLFVSLSSAQIEAGYFATKQKLSTKYFHYEEGKKNELKQHEQALISRTKQAEREALERKRILLEYEVHSSLEKEASRLAEHQRAQNDLQSRFQEQMIAYKQNFVASLPLSPEKTPLSSPALASAAGDSKSEKSVEEIVEEIHQQTDPQSLDSFLEDPKSPEDAHESQDERQEEDIEEQVDRK